MQLIIYLATANMANITINETLCFIFPNYGFVANDNISVMVSSLLHSRRTYEGKNCNSRCLREKFG